MEVSRIRALRGPNLWTRHTAIEAMVQCDGPHDELDAHPQFEKRLRQLFPPLGNLRSTDSKVRLSMAHALEVSTLHLQIEAGCPVTFSRTTSTPDKGLYQVTVEYTEEAVGKRAIEFATELCMAAWNDQSFDLESAIKNSKSFLLEITIRPVIKIMNSV